MVSVFKASKIKILVLVVLCCTVLPLPVVKQYRCHCSPSLFCRCCHSPSASHWCQDKKYYPFRFFPSNVAKTKWQSYGFHCYFECLPARHGYGTAAVAPTIARVFSALTFPFLVLSLLPQPLRFSLVPGQEISPLSFFSEQCRRNQMAKLRVPFQFLMLPRQTWLYYPYGLSYSLSFLSRPLMFRTVSGPQGLILVSI